MTGCGRVPAIAGVPRLKAAHARWIGGAEDPPPGSSAPFLVCDVRANFLQISRGLLRFPFQQFARFLVNLPMPLGKALNQLLRNTLDLEIPSRFILYVVAASDERPDDFMIIDNLGELFRQQ